MMINFNKTEQFILIRYKEDIGGFGATPLLPPTLEDTYFGVKGLYFLNLSHLKSISFMIFQYIESFSNVNFLDLLSLYRLISICEYLHKEIPTNILKKVKNNLKIFLTFQKNPLRLYVLWYINNKILQDKEILKEILNNIKISQIKTLEDLYYIGKIDKKTWVKNINFVLHSQNGDGGFGFYPKTTSFLENTYYAIKILKDLNFSDITLINKGLEFIKACQKNDGGFGRTPGGISYLETTAMALEILQSRGERI